MSKSERRGPPGGTRRAETMPIPSGRTAGSFSSSSVAITGRGNSTSTNPASLSVPPGGGGGSGRVSRGRPRLRRRRHRGVGDVGEPLRAGPALGALSRAAVGGRLTGTRFLALGKKKLPVPPRVDEIPGERQRG